MTKRIALLGYYHGPKLGIAAFVERFIATVGEAKPPGIELLLYTNTNTLRHIGPPPRNVRVIHSRMLSLGPFSAIFWSAFCFPLACVLRRVDAALIMSNPIVLFSWIPTVSVIHDLNELEMPEKYDRLRSFYRRYLMLPSAMRNSDALTTVSPFVKGQIRRFFPKVPQERVFPVSHPPKISALPATAVREQLKQFQLTPDSYYLVMGRIDPMGKNLYPTLDLFRKLEAERPGYTLVFAGGMNESTRAEAETFLRRLRDDAWLNRRTRYLGFVDDAARAALYQGATALLFYSRFEGLGLPLYEAFKLGCPVVINPACRALVEGAKGAAFPVDEAALKQERPLALGAIYDKDARRNLLARMADTAAQNSWPRCIDAYLDVLLHRAPVFSKLP